jgi:hypothetical protein
VLADLRVSVTVTDDDPAPVVALADAAGGEGASLTFVVSLSNPSAEPVGVSYAVAAVTAEPGIDFAAAAGVLTIPAGATGGAIVLPTFDDAASEGDETFLVELVGALNAAIGKDRGIGTIVDNDGPLKATFDAYVTVAGQAIEVAAAAGVLFNDPAPAAGPATAFVIDLPDRGGLLLAADGGFRYLPDAGFAGVDRFTYGARDGGGRIGEAEVEIAVVPVRPSAPPTLDLLALSPEQQIAGVYVAFFDRAPDFGGFDFWRGEFARGLTGGKTPPQLLADIASSFAVSAEAKSLYAFFDDPGDAATAEIETFLASVYDNLFGRPPDAAGLAYWTGRIGDAIAAGAFVGDVLVDIMSGAQNSSDGADISTLMHKVEVGLYYARRVGETGAEWTTADDYGDAVRVLDGVSSDPASALAAIAEAERLIDNDLSETLLGVTAAAGSDPFA